MSGLRIAPELELPVDAVTETFAILAKRGAGKSNAAVVMAEQMYDAGQPWVAIDPKGDWWGIRSSRDGKGAGLPVLVLGGQHGDVPLEPTAGRLVADLVVDQRLTCVVDVSLMSKTDMRRFLADFAERLYQSNTDPLHVFAEEAHEYIPQQVPSADTRMVGAWEKLVKWGRTHGLGVTLITQRSARVNKDVLTQVETLIALRTTGPQDQAAIRAWVDEHESGAAMMAQLRKLGNGEAFVLSPQWLELDEPLRVRFTRRRTFDSGATPRAGEKRVQPRSVAEVDLAALKEAMAETIERAKLDDPKLLRRRIAVLEQDLEAERNKPAPDAAVQVVTVPVLPPEVVEQLTTTYDRLSLSITEWAEQLGTANGMVDQVVDQTHKIRALIRQAAEARDTSTPGADTGAPVRGRTQRGGMNRRPGGEPSSRPVVEVPKGTLNRGSRRPATTDGAPALGKTERNILTVLVQHGPRTHSQVALLAGYSAKASTIGVALGKLRKAGYVEPGQPITATQDGVDRLGDYEPLPIGAALIDYWRSRFGLTEQRVLDAVLDAWPESTSQAEIAEVTGYSPTASTIGVALGRLRKVEVIDKWRISDDFAAAAGL